MKIRNTLLALFCIGSFLYADAQITLNQNNTPHSPSYDDVRYYEFSPAAIAPTEGADITYDYSSIGNGFIEFEEYSPATRAGFTDLTRFDLGGAFLGPLSLTSEYYTHVTSEGVADAGIYKLPETINLLTFTGNPADELFFPGNNTVFSALDYSVKFPTNFGDSWTTNKIAYTDFVISVAAFGLSAVSGSQTQYITTEYSAAGWGELIIPTEDGTSIPYDVIMIKKQEVRTDSTFLAGAPAPTALLSAFGLVQAEKDTLSSYIFYASGFETNLLKLEMSNDFQTITRSLYSSNNIETATPPLYVDIDAAGNNDGSSWTDAYNNLSDALENASANDEIWVADGTYLPNVPSLFPDPTKRTFLLWQDHEIYGGFNGTETSRSQRDPSLNVTILSGDINGDDIADDFVSNRSDNIVNVLYGNGTLTDATILDGFTIMGGHADGNPATYTDLRGAGMFTFGPLQTSNCIITQNYATNHGAGIYYYEADANGGKVLDCTFTNNEAGQNGGGLFAAFLEEEGFLLDNCTFTNNVAGDTGGGFITVRSKCIVSNSNFTNNTSINSGGGATLSNALTGSTFSNCNFTENTSGGGGGGAELVLLTANQSATVENCTFSNNIGGTGGGLYCQGTGLNNNITVSNCTMTGNHANLGTLATGGGLDITYGETNANGVVIVENCQIMNNTTTGSGGGIAIRDQSTGNNHFEVRNSVIEGNTADSNAGGFLHYKTSNNNSSSTISHITFTNNNSPQALGIGFASTVGIEVSQEIKIENCLFKEHSGTNTTAALVFQFFPAQITNCTVSGNSPAIIAGDASIITLQNNILHTPGLNNIIATSSSNQFISLGGNLFSDATASAWAVDVDQLDSDPLFETGTFQLSQNSSAVDAGTMPDNIADFDLAGNARIQGGCIDIGAYESSYDAGNSCLSVAVKEEIVSSSAMEIFPNPTSDVANISLKNDWKGTLSLRIVNVLGQTVQSIYLEKNSELATWNLDTNHLSKGTYKILLSNGSQMAVKTLVVLR